MDTKNAHKKPSGGVSNEIKEQATKQILLQLFDTFKATMTALEINILQAILVEDKTLREIADKVQLPTTRVKQIFNGAIPRLNKRLEIFMQRYETAVKSEKEVEQLRTKLEQFETKKKNQLSLPAKTRGILPMEITAFNFSSRLRNVLHNNDIYKVADLVKLQKRNLLGFRNSGKLAVKEVDEFFTKHGLSWGMDV